MGLLVDGQWQDKWYDTASTGGKFERSESGFRNWVTEDGSAGPSGRAGFPAAAGRYHLYVSLACPWAHRTLVFRELKGLQEAIAVSIVDWFMGKDGWTFAERDGATGDRLYGLGLLHELYTKAKPDYSGRVTVPVLWDSEQETVVSNESSEIIRMLNGPFARFGRAGRWRDHDFNPPELRERIEAVNERVYGAVNNGVYKAGFATTQEAYEAAFHELFETLDWLEETLAASRYLAGAVLTEADWRLFTTLVRFDAVYHGHFKCNLRRIADYPALSGFLRELYQMPGIAGTVDLHHIKHHYYASHETINPTRIVPLGPDLDLAAPHGRERLAAA